MIYEYLCQRCQRRNFRQRAVEDRENPTRCDSCGVGDCRRVFTVNFSRPLQEHWNHTVGKPISDHKQFRHELKRRSEELEEKTGIPHDLQPVDVADRDSLGVTDEGLDATFRRRADEGRLEVKRYL